MPDTAEKEAERIAESIWEILRPLSEDMRVEVKYALTDIVCLDCGYENEGRHCYCLCDD
jgi:hypothetical protein